MTVISCKLVKQLMLHNTVIRPLTSLCSCELTSTRAVTRISNQLNCITSARVSLNVQQLRSSLAFIISRQKVVVSNKKVIMAVISLIIFVQIVVCCSGNINIMCKDGDDEHSVKCRFMETGSYTLINLNEAVKPV